MAGTYAFGGTNLKKGASGDTVRRIQEALNTHGYGLGVDGIWGDKTDAALRDYQGKNGLTADGIYGVNTHNSLFGIAGNNSPSKPTAPNSYSDIDLSKYDSGYQKSQDVINAEQKKSDAENAVNSYGDFSYSKDDEFKAIMDKILNREKFSYDLNGDALYQQYKDKYIQQGKMAMQDTMGQAAAMTGGYGNSYAATVGNQAYQASLENLNDVVPELYQLALDKYNQEGQDLYNQYGMMSDDRNTEYAMWGDKYNQLVADRDYYGNAANNAYAKGYGEWADQRNFDTNQYWNETNFGYGKYRDSVSDWESDRAFEEAQRQFNEQMAFNREQWDWQKEQAEAKNVVQDNTPPKDDTPSGEDKPKNYFDYSEEENQKNVEENGGSYYAQTLSVLKQMKASGKSNAEVSAYLNEVVGNSYITRQEYATLYNKYRDNKL